MPVNFKIFVVVVHEFSEMLLTNSCDYGLHMRFDVVSHTADLFKIFLIIPVLNEPYLHVLPALLLE